MFHLMTFFDSSPNNRAIDFFTFAAKVPCNSLRGTETPNFVSLGLFVITISYRIHNQMGRDSFFRISLGLICLPRTCGEYKKEEKKVKYEKKWTFGSRFPRLGLLVLN